MAQKAEESNVVSKVSVDAVGVESLTDNSGVVLVSAKSDVTDSDNSRRPPMLWRIVVKIERDGGQLKISGVDFLDECRARVVAGQQLNFARRWAGESIRRRGI